jgi:hypothetical protein
MTICRYGIWRSLPRGSRCRCPALGGAIHGPAHDVTRMSIVRTPRCGGSYDEKSSECLKRSGGYRAGSLELTIPNLRQGSYFREFPEPQSALWNNLVKSLAMSGVSQERSQPPGPSSRSAQGREIRELRPSWWRDVHGSRWIALISLTKSDDLKIPSRLF